MLLEKCGGGSVDLYKNEDNGIATLLINNPAKKNALSGKKLTLKVLGKFVADDILKLILLFFRENKT